MRDPLMSGSPAWNDVDPNTFEQFLEPEEYVDHGQLFATDRIFNSKVELVNWAKETAIKVNTYLSSRTSNRRPYKIYNSVAKIKKNRMQGRNTVEEVLCLRCERGYTVFYRNCEYKNVL
ncbi:hypothetical protein M9H77_25761 [Catharanthus roseus]|uniref:Uncharacterized protein n=1 Tax=Catharanthus roseus TaxID=4058 RepID=A0ACC0A7T0_CATRO|nr:hypothetical protein M9H77_25761 [Catharanthus roseus]